jgi:hypothetical protein
MLLIPACTVPTITSQQNSPNAGSSSPTKADPTRDDTGRGGPSLQLSPSLSTPFRPEAELDRCMTWIHFKGTYKNEAHEGTEEEFWVKNDKSSELNGQWGIVAFQGENRAVGSDAGLLYSIFLPSKRTTRSDGLVCHFEKTGPTSDRRVCRLTDPSRITNMFVENSSVYIRRGGKKAATLKREGTAVVIKYLGRRGAMGYGHLQGRLVTNECP